MSVNVLPTILTVKADAALERAIAAELSSNNDVVPESFLNQMSVDYPKKVKTIVENPLDEYENKSIPPGKS